MRELLLLAEKASKNYEPSNDNADDKRSVSRKSIELFFKFLTSRTGIFLKKPLVYELSEAIDGIASIGEANLLRISKGIIRPLPGGNGPVNTRRMEELQAVLDVVQSALEADEDGVESKLDGRERMDSMMEFMRDLVTFVGDGRRREEFMPVLEEVSSVFQQVAVRVLEIRGSRVMRTMLNIAPAAAESRP
jgi:hypothetical protein